MKKSCSSCKWKLHTDTCAHPDMLDQYGTPRAGAKFTRSKKGPCAKGEMWGRKNPRANTAQAA